MSPAGSSVRRHPLKAALAALVLACLPLQAGAGATEQMRVAIDQFVQAAGALEKGDQAAAAPLLETLHASTGTIHALAADYRQRAEQRAGACNASVVALEQQIATAYQDSQKSRTEFDAVHQQLTATEVQLNALQKDVEGVNAELRAMQPEAAKRRWCNEHQFRALFDGDCIAWSFADAFAGRYRHLNNRQADLLRQRQKAWEEFAKLRNEHEQLSTKMHEQHRNVEALEAQRRRLEAQNVAAREMAASLVAMAEFWGRADVVVAARVADPAEILRDLLPTLEQTSSGPVFGSEEQSSLRSLRERMLDFARTVDAAPGFLAPEAACR